MTIHHTHHNYVRRRQIRRSRRRLRLACVFSVILLLLCMYGFSSFSKKTATPLVQTATPQTSSVKKIHPVWPAVGQAAVGSVEDGLLAHSSDHEELLPTASMAKVIAALAIMEKQSFNLGQAGKTYKLTSHDVANYREYVAKSGSVLPVYEGMVLTQYEAMQAMLIPSANNIADMLTERTFGSKEAYISYAQNMLHRMGLNRTIITDASGFNSSTVSTPSELVAIGIAALKNPVIAEIVAQPQALIPGVGVVTNTNELLEDDGVIGVKTGTTNEAGSCLLFAARYTNEDGQKVTLVGVIMGDTNAPTLFNDSRNLLASVKQELGIGSAKPASDSAPQSSYRNDAAKR